MTYSAPDLFIGGRSLRPAGARQIAVYNPADEELLGHVAAATSHEAELALKAAQSGFEIWRHTPHWQRGDVLRRIGALIRERCDSIVHLVVLEIGKPAAEARGETLQAAEYFEWCADEARRLTDERLQGRLPGAELQIKHQPIGVVLALTAWNFPIILAARKLSAALAAGCSVIVRPAGEAPASVAALVACCHDAGLPDGTVNLLFGSPDEVLSPLMRAPAVRKVSFTGSTAVGKIIFQQSAETIKQMTLELGGHAPFIVLPDADVDHAAAMAVAGKFRNAGQVCTSPSRFFVHDQVFDAFLSKFEAGARALKLGNGLDPTVQMGPLATERQRDRAERYVADAVEKGARVVCGGRRPPGFNRGFYYEPTLLTDLAPDSMILTEEPFIPVAPVLRIKSLEEAVEKANALEAGLSSYLFTRSLKNAERVTSELQAGLVGVNTIAVAMPEGPFGGVKASGFGREGGKHALEEFMTTKFINRTNMA
ncbi:NAD-dependent succinate-semialdehyde dehydrogenase [Mesorhizobium sp. M7A.F.Ca.US.006.01.1.1]|uniref:NAD-dependent succinate-semialdehyde dehydrogenase n=1 Tax=Mesorhizobium sp. M7A.F.Ca.US.006.01.1.1 TaxID=2496707 RepID=UPI000FCCC0EB|nr:NAD-dependent succinate-semialdehyde dehydrogenase [Mesorhizobium sp. M7A.F.Ca.US.006.01.1.1]RUZ74040.1 NAD-dependent succinate-semialdehyde dehydrogenase [Mesorhizobium sp. M7A.F.Ca.US.006.01.1.1]